MQSRLRKFGGGQTWKEIDQRQNNDLISCSSDDENRFNMDKLLLSQNRDIWRCLVALVNKPHLIKASLFFILFIKVNHIFSLPQY